MTLLALGVNWAAYWGEVKYLYSFITPEHINAFVGITQNFHWTTTAILMAYLGVQGAVDWRHGTTNAISSVANFVREEINEKREEHVKIEEHHVREEGKNAPAMKPFGQQANGDEEGGEYNDF